MEDRVLTGTAGYTHGSRVSLPGLAVAGYGLTGDHVAGVLWSRRRHPPEDRAPSPSTLPISHSISRLSLGLISLSTSLDLPWVEEETGKAVQEKAVQEKRRGKRREEERKEKRGRVRVSRTEKKKEEELGGGAAVRLWWRNFVWLWIRSSFSLI
jgi:hypothetical protein